MVMKRKLLSRKTDGIKIANVIKRCFHFTGENKLKLITKA